MDDIGICGSALAGEVKAVRQVRMTKAAPAIEDVFTAAVRQAYTDGVSDAQAMTGFTDETVQAVLDKEGIALGPDGLAL